MSDKFKFKLNYAGVGQLLKSYEMQNVLKSYADDISARAGDGYDVFVGRSRANVSVVTDQAAQENLDGNILLKAVRG